MLRLLAGGNQHFISSLLVAMPSTATLEISLDEGEDDDSICCSEPDSRKAREVCLTLIQTHNLCQESYAATAAISWLGKWQRH